MTKRALPDTYVYVVLYIVKVQGALAFLSIKTNPNLQNSITLKLL
jgi:hypothetical protein